MRDDLLTYYERELAFVRQMGAEFSQKYPKIASRLLLEPARGTERAMHFRIDAMLVVDPAPERVTFDTALQLVNGEYKVQEK